MRKDRVAGLVVLLLASIVAVATGFQFRAMLAPDEIIPGPGVTRVTWLSEYFPALAGTPGDTRVYLLEGEEPGGTFVVLGGSHPDEIAGIIGATLLVENAQVKAGRLIVIPHANASGSTHSPPMEAYPQTIAFTSRSGNERSFRFGSRLTNPLHQWPDPEVYVHATSGQPLSGQEVRNLNRAHPGRPDGNLTERIAYGIRQLIESEQADMVLDMHEASPEYPVVNAVVSHDRAVMVASFALFSLLMEDIELQLEISPKNLRGLSHRELGDSTSAYALLTETPNPSQGRLRGATHAELVITGRDSGYVKAAQLGYLYVPFDDAGHPIGERAGVHLSVVRELAAAFSELHPEAPIVLSGIPSVDALVTNGIGKYLN